MKKSLYYAVSGLLLASCASDVVVEEATGGYKQESNAPIRFITNQKNITRAYSPLQENGNYNFGVFAYKSTDLVNPVMPNYLVGYYDEEKGYQKAGSTWGDEPGREDGLSYWMYEGMGNAEYNGTYAGGALTAAYTSNNANQYLKYWDNAAEATYFYAYAPYINSGVKATATYVDGTAQSATGDDTYVLTIPNETLTDGYDDPALSEYMYASAKVVKSNYGHDVALQFKRLNAKVNIKFWEDVPGWKVRILNLSDTYNKGVYAAASIKDGESGQYGYRAGKYYTSNGARIQFADGVATGTKQFFGTTADNTKQLIFAAPTVAQIGENRYEAAPSATTYYAIPKGADADGDGTADEVMDNSSNSLAAGAIAADADLIKTGFTFHVSYELTAEDTGEKIVVKNATVHVPYTYCNWKENTHYTYIFKITTKSNGTTDENPTIDPSDPEVPVTPALYPIVFDNCTIVDWEENESEWEITEGENGPAYHNITLTEGGANMYSFKSDVAHSIIVTISDADTYLTHDVDYSAVAVTGPDPNVTYSAGVITVPENAAAGLYTVTYTCPAPDAAHVTHPAVFTQTFFIGNDYAVDTHHDIIGTNWSGDATSVKLTISTKKDGASEATAGASGTLSVVYPDNFTDAQKALVKVDGTDVVVMKNAVPGVYKLVYTIAEGTKQVVVAEKLFTVKDYSLVLNQTVVFNNGGTLTVKGNQPASTDNVYTTTVGSVDGNVITVPNATADNTTITVTYTVWNGTDVAKTAYTATFVVKDTHSVAVDKSAIDRNLGTSAEGEMTHDNIVVTTLHNGVATENVSSSLSVVKLAADGTETATAAGDFTIVYDTANKCNLKVKNTVDDGDYYVKYVSNVGGESKAEYVHFVVTK